jgi:diacylglycerol kinase (ATP)
LKVAIVLNGISLRKKFFYREILPVLTSSFQVEVFETLTQSDAVVLASEATNKKFDVIFAGGGDGTVHQVLNGILNDRVDSAHLPVLGVIPIGSGNDFARALRLKADAKEITAHMKNMHTRTVDVGKITYHTSPSETEFRYFINEVDLGMGPEVVKRVMASDSPFGASVSYYMAILATFLSYKAVPVKAVTPDWTWEGKVRTLAIANGNYYGHGICISPDSKPDDGKFGTFICAGVSVFDFIRYSNALKKGKYVRIPEIMYNEASSIELTSPQQCVIEADGEILGHLPAKIEALPRRIRLLC